MQECRRLISPVYVSGGLQSDLGDPVRLPVPQVVRRHRQIRQGVRPRRLGPRQPGQPVCLSVSSAICGIMIAADRAARCKFERTLLRSLRGGLLDISTYFWHLGFYEALFLPSDN